MSDEQQLRGALQSGAPSTNPDDAAWAKVGTRAHALKRRRRIMGGGVALALALVLAVGVLALTSTFDDSASRSIVATPSPNATDADPGDVVASLDHSIVVLSSEDGHITRTLYDGLNQGGGVTAAPDGGYVYFTRGAPGCDANLPPGTGGISRVGLTGSSPQDVIGGASDPLISPDGRWLAYSFATCDAPEAQHIGVLDLTTNTQYWPLDGTGPEHAVPAAWSTDSQSLLYLNSSGHVIRIDGIPAPSTPPTDMTSGLNASGTAATFTHDNSLLIARQEAQTFIVQHMDPVPAGIGIRFIAEGRSPSAMEFDTGDRLLLVAADGTLSVQEGTSTETTWQSGHSYPTDPRVLRHDVRGAAWLPHAAAPPTSTTTPPPTSTTGPTTTTEPVPLDTFAEQVARLNAWYHNWPAEAPGGRPILSAEYEYCTPASGATSPLQANSSFASYFPLDQPLTEARLVDGCITATNRFPDGNVSSPPLETPINELPAHRICATNQEGPIQQPGNPPSTVLKPVVLFIEQDCFTAGYQDPPADFLDQLNERRRTEIHIRAVPDSCPSEEEATQWATSTSRQETGTAWTSATLTSTGRCYRPAGLDWDRQQFGLQAFDPVIGG